MRLQICARDLVASAALFLSLSPAASAVTIDWTPIGDPGNACDTQTQGCFGAVSYGYSIGTYEVTNAQYAEFLNAKAASDPLGLYNSSMGSGLGGITQTGSDGSYSYNAITGRENMPVVFVQFFDTLRFANWLENGQGGGSTETGAYTLQGGTAIPSNATSVTRNGGATIVLPSENEWYKAAYYDAFSTSYFDYPAGTDTQTTCAAVTATPNSANCGNAVLDLTIAGSYTGSASPSGTFDQGGNVWEWNEAVVGLPTARGMRGGSWGSGGAITLAGATRSSNNQSGQGNTIGFRVALVPEPGTGLLVMMGLLGVALGRKRSA